MVGNLYVRVVLGDTLNFCFLEERNSTKILAELTKGGRRCRGVGWGGGEREVGKGEDKKCEGRGKVDEKRGRGVKPS